MLIFSIGLLSIIFIGAGFPGLCVVLLCAIGVCIQNPFYSLCGVRYIDGIRQVLIVLRVYISLLMIVVRIRVEWITVFIGCVVTICICLTVAFRAVNVFFFYTAFEGVLIPTMILILG